MKPVCVVVGVGPGNGAAFARRFASEGYAVALLARTAELTGKLASSLPDARAYACDVTDAGSSLWGSIEEATAADFEAAWRMALIVVDGVVDLPRTRERMPDKPDSFFVKPDDVAEIGFRLTQQRPSAWSFEVEARPFAEKW